MSTEATTPTSDGALTVDQAAEAFNDMLDPPEEDKPAEDEAPGEEGEDEPDDTSTSQDEEEGNGEEADEEETSGELHTIKVNGEERKVSLDDLKAGYQRNEDYTRKTMALAEQRKAAEADHAAVRQEREHYAALLGQLQQQIQAAQPQIDWDRLKAENPQAWAVMKVEQQERERAQWQIQSELNRVNGLRQQEAAQRQQAALVSEEAALLQKIPEWKDPEKARAGKAALIKAGQEYGYTREELSGITDSRAVLILQKAAKYDQLMAKKAALKPDEPSTKPARPQAQAAKPNGLAKASQRLAKSGSVEDAADFFYNAITGGRR